MEQVIPGFWLPETVFLRHPQNGRGWAGWLGLQNAAGSVPEDSVPFGRGPPGCGAAANNGLEVLRHFGTCSIIFQTVMNGSHNCVTRFVTLD